MLFCVLVLGHTSRLLLSLHHSVLMMMGCRRLVLDIIIHVCGRVVLVLVVHSMCCNDAFAHVCLLFAFMLFLLRQLFKFVAAAENAVVKVFVIVVGFCLVLVAVRAVLVFSVLLRS